MRLSITSVLVALGLVSFGTSSTTATTPTTRITFQIPASHILPNPHVLPASTRATLKTLGPGGYHAAPLSVSNSFVFGNVSGGSYLLDVHCATHAFAPLRVDVVPSVGGGASTRKKGEEGEGRLEVSAWETFRGNDWDNKGEKARYNGDGAAFDLRVLGPKSYFMERVAFSVFSILKNPMILLALVSMGIFFGMPYLLENMDPEMRAEFEARQKGSAMNAMIGAAGGPQVTKGPIANFDMAAFLAGSTPKNGNNNGNKNEGASGGTGASSAHSSGNNGGGRKGQGGRR